MIIKTTSSKMALKPYLEALREHCENLSKGELVETLLRLAQEMPVGERGSFLDKIRSFSATSISGKRESGREDGKDLEKVTLDRLQALREEMEERITSIEDGTYWDEYSDREEYEYDDEPEYITEEQRDELENLFLETGDFFLRDRLEAARRLYGALFDLLDEKKDISYAVSPKSMDIREARARYCRCVYETSEPVRRVNDFLECMKVDASMRPYSLDLPSEPFPMLRDVMDARSGELADLASFLPAWVEKLASREGGRAAMLRMEAVQRLEGIDGLARLARNWQSGEPRGYLFWIQCLEENGDWRAMLEACREALDVLPKNSFREQVGTYLAKAALELGEPKVVLLGKRETFFSAPNERNLVRLLEEAQSQKVRSQELETVLTFRKKAEGSREDREDKAASDSLYLKVLLMAGRIGEAFNEGKSEKSVGWSFGRAGILFASLLSVLTGNSPKAVVIGRLLREYAGKTYGYFDGGEEEKSGVFNEIVEGLTSVELSESEKRKYLSWTDKVARERVEQIVSNKHRRAYDRAAMTLGALGECYVLCGEGDKARSLLNEFVNVKFKRYSAFRAEAKGVVGTSALLKDLRVV